eukprot:424389_1
MQLINELIDAFCSDIDHHRANQQSNTTEHSHKCICGQPLIKLDNVMDLNICCDICYRRFCESVTFWHCQQEKKSMLHPDGYDVCNHCYSDYFGQPQNILLEPDFEEKTPMQWTNNDAKTETINATKTPTQKQQCFCSSMDNCPALIRLIKAFDLFSATGNKNSIIMDNKDVTSLLDDYFHLMMSHDMDFDYVASQFEYCNIVNCDMLRRNTRNRTKTIEIFGNKSDAETIDIVYAEIMDKIHCYFCHSIDIGHRLSATDKQSIQETMENMENTILCDKQKNKITQLLTLKRSKLKTFNTNLGRNRCQKFCQIHDNTELENKTQDKMYSFGYNFYYGYEPYTNKICQQTDLEFKENCIEVSKKYDSFKQELTANNICIITMKQYNCEYLKAAIHVNSGFCKKNIVLESRYPTEGHEINLASEFEFVKHSDHKLWYSVDVNYILALMVYCNYDILQYKFSKTYRENNGENHNEFYFLGRYLKRVVAIYGKNAFKSRGDTLKVYHGASKQFLLPQYCSKDDSSAYFGVWGIVMEFTGEKRHFDCAWISDFPNEKEILFIQKAGEFSHELELLNIYDIGSDVEYANLLIAFKLIKGILNAGIDRFDKYESNHMTSSMYGLVQVIVENQLSNVIPKYRKFKSLGQYGQQMCKGFFSELSHFLIDYEQWQLKYSSVAKLFIKPIIDWIDICLVRVLMPNVWYIMIKNVELSKEIISDILCKLDPQQMYAGNLRLLTITPRNGSLSIQQAIKQFNETFTKHGMFVVGKLFDGTMSRMDIWILSNQWVLYQSITDLLTHFGSAYFKGNDFNLSNVLNKCIEEQLSNETDSKQDESYNYVSDYCSNVDRLLIDWRNIAANPNLGPFERFYHSDCNWIKTDLIFKLFPCIFRIWIEYIRLDELVFENILISTVEVNKEIIICLGTNWNSCKDLQNEETLRQKCKELMHYDSDNIFQHDWGNFKTLYRIRDNVENNLEEVDGKLFMVDALIAYYAQQKYEQQLNTIGWIFDVNLGGQKGIAITLKS